MVYYRESINPGAFRRKEPILMNITKRDVQELRKRLTKKACTFDRVTGCYINSGKEVILKFSESFMNLAEEEFFKYLEIAKIGRASCRERV